MADRSPCLLFKETRVNLDWAGTNATVHIPLPRHRSPHRASSGTSDLAGFDAEDTFKHYYHATAASVHYRPAGRYPRCILWRVLEGSTVLSLTSVDFTKPAMHAELQTNFRFCFPEPIKPSCVGFADAPGHDELVVYALTQNGVLYTLCLTPDFLLRNSATKRGARDSDYCKTYSPSAFALHTPHFLLPINHTSLMVSLQDGNILKLTRDAHAPQDYEPSVAKYIEKTFSDSGYFGFIKNRMPWVGSQTVPYGRGSVSQTTVISAAAYIPQHAHDMEVQYHSIMDTLLFTVSVDHALKVWSMQSETLIHVTDLLNEPQPTSTKMKTWLDPSPSHLLAILDTSLQEDHMFYLISFSSATTGKFKFWAVRQDSVGSFIDLVDLYPDYEFEAKPPTATAPWIICEFRVTPASASDLTLFNLWVLWKSDTNFRVQNVQFNLNKVGDTWNWWTTATADLLHDLPKQAPSSITSEDVTDHWMNWIFYPGRFPDPVYETALKIYEDNFATRSEKGTKMETTQARVARVVASAVELKTGTGGMVDYEKYRVEIELQWERFSRLCTEVDKARCEALSLVTDPASGFVWTVNVDGITALRECTESEVVSHNYTTHADNLDLLSHRTPKRLGAGLQGKDLGDVMLLVGAAEELKSALSESALDRCALRLKEEITKDAMYSVQDVMWSVYEHCLDGEVTQETIDKLKLTFKNMTEPQNAFSSIMSSLFHADAHAGATRLTAFGGKVLVAGSQEVIHTNHELLFNLTFLLLFVTAFEDVQDFRISHPEEIYSQLLMYCKEYEVLRWMAENSLALPEPPIEDDVSEAMTDLRLTGDDGPAPEKRKGSVLQLVLPNSFGPPPPGPGRSGLVALSLCIRQFLSGLDLIDYGNGITNIVSALLKSNARGLATDFAKFIPSTSWGTYMKARVRLKARDDIAAATFFKKAAYGMSIANQAHFSPIGSFLSALELEHAVGGGLPKYHLHVAGLYEEARAPLYVVEFCNTALVALGSSDNATVRTEVLLKLFQAALHVSMFDEAYLALIQYTNEALQRTAIRDLVCAMVEQSEGARLCSYPFIGLQDEVDEALEDKCQSMLDVATGPPFHKILYSWRIQKGDFRGAASILYERLRRLQTANVGSADPHSRAVTNGFLALINALSCVDKDQAYILASARVEETDTTVGASAKRTKRSNGIAPSSSQRRRLITLADIKAEYRLEVERLGLLLNGGFFV